MHQIYFTSSESVGCRLHESRKSKKSDRSIKIFMRNDCKLLTATLPQSLGGNTSEENHSPVTTAFFLKTIHSRKFYSHSLNQKYCTSSDPQSPYYPPPQSLVNGSVWYFAIPQGGNFRLKGIRFASRREDIMWGTGLPLWSPSQFRSGSSWKNSLH